MQKLQVNTLPFFPRLYKIFSLLLCFSLPLHAASTTQELKACKAALKNHLNGQITGSLSSQCPTGQKLAKWLGILRKPEAYSPQQLIAFLKAHSHWPQHETLRRKAEEVIAKQGSTKEILEWFGVYEPLTPDGVMAYGKALLNKNERTKSAKLAVKAWRTMDFTKKQEQKFIARFGHLLQEKDKIARLKFLLAKGETQTARRLFSHIPVNVRKVAEVRIAFIQNQSNAPQLMKALPASLQKDESLVYESAKRLRKKNQIQEAAALLLSAPETSDLSKLWWKERNYVARELIAEEKYKKAYDIVKKHKLVPGTEEYADAEWLAGWLALRFLDNSDGAIAHFKNLYENVKGAISKARGAYWAGRAYEAQNELQTAGQWYKKGAPFKTVYYGQLSAMKVRENDYPALAASPSGGSQAKQKFEAKDTVKAARLLKGLGSEATNELRKFLYHVAGQADSQAERELAVHLAHELAPEEVVWTAKKAGHRHPVLVKKAFPSHSLPKGQACPEHAFVMAIIYQESRFRPREKSHAGAMGLMQLLASTAKQEARRLKVKHNTNMLYNPQHNIRLGSSHLNHLLKEFSGSYVLTAAAYNAGPAPVARWLETFGDPRFDSIDMVDWVELIPYHETRSYVQRVLEIVTAYRSLQGAPKKTLVNDLAPIKKKAGK